MGRTPSVKRDTTPSFKMHCVRCKGKFDNDELYKSNPHNEFFRGVGRLPLCKDCLDDLYHIYLVKYENWGYPSPSRRAIEKICSILDMYYSDKLYDMAFKDLEFKPNATLFSLYVQKQNLNPYKRKDYDTTIQEREAENIKAEKESKKESGKKETEVDRKEKKRIDAAKKIFGEGFKNYDYMFLLNEYEDWIARHECETKSQEEVFKEICFTQLELHKARRSNQDTKDLNTTFLKQLDAAKLQPKQSSGDTTAANQTFGTLIEKWENERPIPEIDESLRDVDKIGTYIDVFFKGHLSVLMGIKNIPANIYKRFMKRYTVEKPEYKNEEENEALFEAVFGKSITGDEE